MKQVKNVANMSKEDLDNYRRVCFQSYNAQKYEYCNQIGNLNHFLNKKDVCYPLRRELNWDSSQYFEFPETSLMRQLIIADASITVNKNDDISISRSTESASVSLTEEPSSNTVTNQESMASTISKKEESKFNLDFSMTNAHSVGLDFKHGGIRITLKNFQLVLKVLGSLRKPDCPSKVYSFFVKIINSIENAEFVVLSSSHLEKLKHLFFYKLLKYAGYALKNIQGANEEVDNRLSTPSIKSNLSSELSSEFVSDVNKYVSSNVKEHITNVLDDPSSNAGSVGFIAGLSCTLEYLDPSISDSVLSALRNKNFLDSENFVEVIPLCINLIEKSDDKFSKDEIDKMMELSLKNTKKNRKKSKKLYLSLNLLLSTQKDGSLILEDGISKFNIKVFFKSKPLAKLFIRHFISTYYTSNPNDSQQNLELLVQSLKQKQEEYSSKKSSSELILNYIYSEILSYDIMKQTGESFENMNMYSLIHDVFKSSEHKLDSNQSVVKKNRPHRQINFFLKIYEN